MLSVQRGVCNVSLRQRSPQKPRVFCKRTSCFMYPALAKTIELLSRTPNQAALDALLPGLDSKHLESQLGALQGILDRRSPVGQEAILNRLEDRHPAWDEVLEKKHGRLNQALRDAVVSSNPARCSLACQAIVRYREYDLTPSLIAVTEAIDNEAAEVAAMAVLQLSQQLYDEIAGPRDYRERRDPQFVRRTMIAHLEKSVERYPEHHSKAIIESFLLLASRENAILQTVLYDSHHTCYLPILDVLSHGAHLGVMRLLLDYLDSNQAPSAVLSIIMQRNDRGFIRRLIARWRDHATPAMRRNTQRLETFCWADTESAEFTSLEGEDQLGALSLILASGMPRDQALRIVRHFLRHGELATRRAAMLALQDFDSPESDMLIATSLRDHDPEIITTAVCLARQRNIPGVLPQLLQLVEGPYEQVRLAVREQLSEFHFESFWASFDFLEDDARLSTGELVRRIDPASVNRLRDELASDRRNRRIKAAAVAAAMNVASQLEPQLIDLMQDDDELVREEVARALGGCRSTQARVVLTSALEDRFPSVRAAAQFSLNQIKQQANAAALQLDPTNLPTGNVPSHH